MPSNTFRVLGVLKSNKRWLRRLSRGTGRALHFKNFEGAIIELFGKYLDRFGEKQHKLEDENKWKVVTMRKGGVRKVLII